MVVINSDWFLGYFVGNTLWLIAIGYYLYITFLGYNSKCHPRSRLRHVQFKHVSEVSLFSALTLTALPFLTNTAALLYPFALLGLLYILSVSLGWNFTRGLCWFYKHRVQ